MRRVIRHRVNKSYDLVELRASYPVLCARFLDKLDHSQMVTRFGPDYPEKHRAEAAALADYYQKRLPWQ